MPPTSVPVWPESEARVDLSQQDIKLLYEIVTYAALIPETTPWNALFNAYDAVLRSRGIDPRQDDICFRFLMRMAEVQYGTWYEKYVALLQRWGHDLPDLEEQSNEETISGTHIENIRSPPRQRARIASNNSEPHQNGRTDTRRISSEHPQNVLRRGQRPLLNGSSRGYHRVRRDRSSSSRNSHHDEEELRRRQRAATRAEFAFPIEALEENTESSSVVATVQEEEVISSTPPATSSPIVYNENVPPSSPPPRPSGIPRRPYRHPLQQQLVRRSPPPPEYTSVHDFLPSEDEEVDEVDEEVVRDHESIYTEALPPIRSQQEYIQAATKAAGLYNRGLHSLVHRAFSHWYSRRRYHQLRESVARKQDRIVLLSQALQGWREGAYWKGINRRATKKHELELMRKAFDIWRSKIKAIRDRRERVNNGILLHKCFAAWKKHAIEMNQKVESVPSRAFLHLWQRKLQNRRLVQGQAELVYNNNLKYRAYWTWYFKYCGNRVPLYHGARLKLHFLTTLRNELAVRQEQMQTAAHHYNASVARRSLCALIAALSKQKQLSDVAENRCTHKLLSNTLNYWNKAAKLQPAADVIQDLVNDRVTYECFSHWRAQAETRSRQEIAAKEVDKTKLLRSMFRVWNMELRARVLGAKIDQRILTDVMYTWVLRWRENLFLRLRDRRLQGEAFGAMISRLHKLSESYDSTEAELTATRRERSLQNALACWKSARRHTEILEEQARLWQRHTILRRSFQALRTKMESLRQMDELANVAVTYTTTKYALKKWRIVAKETSKMRKKRERKPLYELMIRKRNTNLAKQCFRALLKKLDHVQDLNHNAKHFSSIGSDDLMRTFLTSWRGQLHVVQSNFAFAEDRDNMRTLGSALSVWKHRSTDVKKLYTLADIHYGLAQRDYEAVLLQQMRETCFSIKVKNEVNNLKADRFLKRAETTRKKKYLRGWVRLRRQRLQAKQNIFEFHRQSLSPDENDADVLEEISRLNISDWIKAPLAPDTAVVSRGFNPSKSMNRLAIAAIEGPKYPSTPGGRAAKARAIMSQSVPPLPRLNILAQSHHGSTAGSTTPLGTPFKKKSFQFPVSPSITVTKNGEKESVSSNDSPRPNGKSAASLRKVKQNGIPTSSSTSSRIPLFQRLTSTASTFEVDDLQSINGKLSSSAATTVDGGLEKN